MRAELRHIQKSIGVTTIFVTHDQLEAMTMADRILVMKDGQMLQFATPQEIFERPATEFVATFVGEPQMNVFDAKIVEENGVVMGRAGKHAIPFDHGWVAANRLGDRVGQRVRIGIRPEHIAISKKPDAVHTVAAQLYSFEPTGSENFYVLKCGDIELTTCSSTTETAYVAREPGCELAAGLDPNWLYMFDAETGRTIAQAYSSIHAEGALS
jgi:multiple sugar transport system ATP-binding protein